MYSRLVDVLKLLQEDVRMQSNSGIPLEVDAPMLHTAKFPNIFEMLRSEDSEAQDKLERLAITEEATSGFQSSLSPLGQTTEEHDYIQDDPLADLIDVFMVILVSGEILCRVHEPYMLKNIGVGRYMLCCKVAMGASGGWSHSSSPRVVGFESRFERR